MAKVVSIEVGYTFIRILEMDYQTKNPRVYHYVTVPTPPNVIEDGYLKESANLRGVIKKALANNQITTKRVIFTVASSKILNREVLVPDVKPNMIGNLIKTNLAEYFPIDLTGYSVSHVLLEKLASGPDQGKSRVLIVAAEKDMIKSYETLAISCGLSLAGLDFVGNSIYQAVKKEANKDTAMILKIEENQTIITVVKDNNLMLLRSVNYGVGNLIKDVHHNATFRVPDEEEAWMLLKKRGILKVAFDEKTRIMESDLEHDDNEAYAQARQAITNSAQPLVNSISRVISFYNSRNEDPVNKLYVIGMGGEVNNLTKLFTNELGIPTAVFRRLEGVGWHQSVGDSELFGYVACIGATMNSVSFVEEEKKGKGKGKEVNFTPIAILLLFVFIIGCGALCFMGLKPYRDQVNRKEELEANEQLYLPAEALFNKCNAVTEFYDYIQLGDIATKRANKNILNFLTELEMTLPTDSEISQFTSSQTDVVMKVVLPDKQAAAKFIHELREFKSVQDVSISTIAEEDPRLAAEIALLQGIPSDEEQEPEEEETPVEPTTLNIDGKDVTVEKELGGKVTITISATYTVEAMIERFE